MSQPGQQQENFKIVKKLSTKKAPDAAVRSRHEGLIETTTHAYISSGGVKANVAWLVPLAIEASMCFAFDETKYLFLTGVILVRVENQRWGGS